MTLSDGDSMLGSIGSYHLTYDLYLASDLLDPRSADEDSVKIASREI
jgi:hypothetical protein